MMSFFSKWQKKPPAPELPAPQQKKRKKRTYKKRRQRKNSAYPRILTAAADFFAQKDDATVKEIAALVKVSPQTIHTLFPAGEQGTVEAIARDIASRFIGELKELLSFGLEFTKFSPAKVKLGTVIRSFCMTFRKNPAYGKVVLKRRLISEAGQPENEWLRQAGFSETLASIDEIIEGCGAEKGSCLFTRSLFLNYLQINLCRLYLYEGHPSEVSQADEKILETEVLRILGLSGN